MRNIKKIKRISFIMIPLIVLGISTLFINNTVLNSISQAKKQNALANVDKKTVDTNLSPLTSYDSEGNSSDPLLTPTPSSTVSTTSPSVTPSSQSTPKASPTKAKQPVAKKVTVSNIPVFKPQSFTNNEYGTWVWEPPDTMEQSYMDKVIGGAAQNKINVIYLTVDKYIDLNNIEDAKLAVEKINVFHESVRTFVRKATAKGIIVEAEAGWRDWGEPAKRIKALTALRYVAEYNRSSSDADRVRGLQFDIEPYLLKYYESDKERALTDYVNLVDTVAKEAKAQNLPVSFVIPHFFDGAQKWTPNINFNGSSKATYDHMLDILSKLNNSSIVIMAYRNFAEGEDSTIKLSEEELRVASEQNRNIRIIVAQEVGDVNPDYVTFFGKSKNYYNEQQSIIKSQMSKYSKFSGTAVHYIDPLLELK